MSNRCNRCGVKERPRVRFNHLTFADGKERLYCRRCYLKLVAGLDQELAAGRLTSVKIVSLE